jgi:hypothetical protein
LVWSAISTQNFTLTFFFPKKGTVENGREAKKKQVTFGSTRLTLTLLTAYYYYYQYHSSASHTQHSSEVVVTEPSHTKQKHTSSDTTNSRIWTSDIIHAWFLVYRGSQGVGELGMLARREQPSSCICVVRKRRRQ